MQVWITGMAVWCAVGRNAAEFDRALREGRSGRREVTRFDVSHPIYRNRCAAALQDEATLRAEIDGTLITDLALTIAREATADARLSPAELASDRAAMVLATSHGANLAFMKFLMGRLGLAERVEARHSLSSTPTIIGQVATRLGLRGPTATISTACAAGTNAVGLGAEMIADGLADVAVAGGADIYTPLSFSGFNILGAISRSVCRPFDRARDGLMLGDGCAIFVLESPEHAERRGARPYAIIRGHATTNEAYHPTAPSPRGEGARRVMKAALGSAGVEPSRVDYINLHGTGTPANDAAELDAIADVFGDHAARMPMSATKSMIGHTLGSAGSVEAAAVILGMLGGYAPPTINLVDPIEKFAHWNFVRDVAQPQSIRIALSNSFGFSGHLASIVLARADAHIERAASWTHAPESNVAS